MRNLSTAIPKALSLSTFVCLMFMVNLAIAANIPVLQRGYTPDVAGANLNETILTTSNVSAASFGRVFSLPVDAAIYTQPLYVPQLTINNSVHNVVFISTMNNSIYAYDADILGPPLWVNNYSQTVPGSTAVPVTNFIGTNTGNISGSVGIESTPVINNTTKTIYFVTNTLENGNKVFRLHAIDMTSGAEKFGGPVVISGSVNINGSTISFDPSLHNQRMSLTLAKDQIIVGFSSHEDAFKYYGWIMSYNAANLTLSAIFNAAPTIDRGAGIWQSGRPPVVDSSGYVYLYTGNGFTSNNQLSADGLNNYAESVLKLDPLTLKVIDYFTPANFQDLDNYDLDLSSSGPTLIPGSNVLVGGGKDGNFYFLNTQNLGKLQTNNAGVLQQVSVTFGQNRGGPVFWNRSLLYGGPLLYNWGSWDVLQAYSYNTQTNNINSAPVLSFKGSPLLYPGGVMALSANGNQEGIIWASINSQGDADHRVAPGELLALNAANLQELWNSTMIPARDDLALWSKYVTPLVVNGKVFMATQSNQVVVYGLLPTSGAATVTAWPPRQTVLGAQASYIVNALATTGTPVSATWSVSGLPSGTTGAFQLDAHGKTVLQITLDGTTVPGNYNFNITANVSGNLTSQGVVLAVTPNSMAATTASVIADSEVSPHLATTAIDGDINTFWKTLDTPPPVDYPHYIQLDLGSVKPVAGLSYLPRQDGCVDGTAMQYEVYMSLPPQNNWAQYAGNSFDYGGVWRSFGCDNQSYPQSQNIPLPVTNAQIVFLRVLGAVEDATPWASAAEVQPYVATQNLTPLSVTSSADTITPGQAVTLTATIYASGATGAVQFKSNGVPVDDIPQWLSANGVATLTTTALTNLGSNAITANYWGDTNNYANTSSAINLNVLEPTSISISSSAPTSNPGQNVVLTATVSGANPSGTIQFFNNGLALADPVTLVNGSASLTATELGLGIDAITASYSGDGNNSASVTATPFSQTVFAPTAQTVPALPWFLQIILAGVLLSTGIWVKNYTKNSI